MAGDAAKKIATYQDVLDAPDHFVAEVIRGSLSLMPRPRPTHARSASRLGMSLAGFDGLGPRGPGGWVILLSPELHLAQDIVVPDLAGWRRERMRALPCRMRKRWWMVVLLVGCDPSDVTPDAAVADGGMTDAPTSDVPPSDVPPGDTGGGDAPPLTGCLAGCAMFNDGASECGVSNYDCDALCAESARIGLDSGCVAETNAFWDCFAGAPRGAFCTSAGACRAEMDALDECVAVTPPTDCVRACAVCGDPGYSTCALGCARRDAHAALLGCEESYGAYYTCRLADGCPQCLDEADAYTACWAAACEADTERCPITP